MSKEGRDFVKASSPFRKERGALFWVHYVLGDISDPQDNYQICVGNKKIIDEWPFSLRTVDKAIALLIEGGYLTVLSHAGGKGKPARYRFEFKGAERLAAPERSHHE